LFKSSPVLSIFFNKCYIAIKEANQLLQLNGPENMNAEQQEVIKQNPDISKLKQLTLPRHTDEKKDEQKTEDKNQNDAKLEENVEPKHSKKEFNNENIEGELNLDKQMVSLIDRTSAQFLFVSVSKLHIMEELDKTFDEDNDIQQTKPLGDIVQDTCIQILESKSQLRTSVLLIQEILDLKPANMKTDKSVKLWNAVDNGCINIVNNAIEMMKVSTEYFSFFF